MSIHFSTQVWKHSKATGNTLVVLLALADHADKYGFCWPGVSSLAKKSRVSERTLQRCLRELEKLNEIAVSQGKGGAYPGGRTNLYQITVGGDDSPHARDDTPTGDNSGNPPVTKATEVVTRLSPKPSVEPSEENITMTSDGPSGQVGRNCGINSFSFPEEGLNPPIPSTPLLPDRGDEFCDALMKLRKIYTGEYASPLSEHQRSIIRKEISTIRNCKRLLWLYLAAWNHWDGVKNEVWERKYVEGFHAKFFWPPEQAFKFLNKVEGLLLEGARDRAWYQSLMDDVDKAMFGLTTLVLERPKATEA